MLPLPEEDCNKGEWTTYIARVNTIYMSTFTLRLMTEITVMMLADPHKSDQDQDLFDNKCHHVLCM